MPRSYGYVRLLGKGRFWLQDGVKVDKSANLKMRDYPELFGRAQCSHKLKLEEGRQRGGQLTIAVFGDGSRSPKTKECGQLHEAKKMRKSDPLWSLQKGIQGTP